jgi:hypothetical protein
MKAASSDKKIRDEFFNSLAEKQNRSNESAVGAALGYLHHPLRQQTSVNYLPKSLELLQEIQKTEISFSRITGFVLPLAATRILKHLLLSISLFRKILIIIRY